MSRALYHTVESVAQLETEVRAASSLSSQRTNSDASLGKFSISRKEENVHFFTLKSLELPVLSEYLLLFTEFKKTSP